MKEILIGCLVVIGLLCLYIVEVFVIANIVAFLLRFINIYQIMGYNANYFLFFVFLIIGIIKGTILKRKDDL